MEDRSESVELTNMCMIQNGTKILVEDRKNKTWAGVTFPGGHIEPGESFNHAMVREILKKRVSRSSIHCCAESNNFQEKTIRDILFCCTRQITLKDKSKAQKKGRFLDRTNRFKKLFIAGKLC